MRHTAHTMLSVTALVLLLTLMPAEARAQPVRLVATFSIVGDLVRNVSGEHATLRILVGPDADAHTFEPTPADGVALAEAAVIFEHGLGFETWLDRLCLASPTTARRVVVTQGLVPLTRSAARATQRDGALDPHVWHDVRLVIHMVHVIRDALAHHDPARATAYQTNAARYIAALEQLDAWVREYVHRLPRERRKLVTSHDTFGYFARRYGFEVVGAVLPSFSTETSDPSGAELARLVDTVKTAGVPVIFAENVQNPRLLQRVATTAGVRLGPPLYTDALGPPGSPGESYIKMMRHNVTAIMDALRP